MYFDLLVLVMCMWICICWFMLSVLKLFHIFASCRCFTYISKTNDHALHEEARRIRRSTLCRTVWCWSSVNGEEFVSPDSDNDTGLAFDNFSDHCPELAKKRLQTIKWIRKLPFVSLPWPSGLLAHGDEPKKSLLNDRRVTLLVAMPSPSRSLIARWAPRERAECFFF